MRLILLLVLLLGASACSSGIQAGPAAAPPTTLDDRTAAVRRYNPARIHVLELKTIEQQVGADTGCPAPPKGPKKPMRCTFKEDEFGEQEEMVCE